MSAAETKFNFSFAFDSQIDSGDVELVGYSGASLIAGDFIILPAARIGTRACRRRDCTGAFVSYCLSSRIFNSCTNAVVVIICVMPARL